MSQREEGFGGPIEGVTFAVIMGVAAFVGRENPRFAYPEILYGFLALLAFNLLNFSFLPRFLPRQRRAVLAVGIDILLLTAVVRWSGGEDSYFWVLYLLPVFNACLTFRARGVWTATAAVMGLLACFHAGSVLRHRGPEVIEPLVKLAIIAASALLVTRVAERERRALRRLEEEQRRMARERAQARERLQGMDRLATLGTLMAGIAHELNAPLATILGYSELHAGEQELPASEAQRLFGRIAESALRCRQIIQDMLAFARQRTVRRSLCDVNALLRECVELKEHDWTGERLRVELDLAADLPRTMLSGPEFQQVIFNLLTNAHQAVRESGAPEGRIRLRARCEGSPPAILVTVQDNGPGVPAAIAERIWEPFFTTKPEGEGTGLGLAICRQIVEAQGGTLTLAAGRGEGAAFVIRLPVAAPAPGTA